MAASIVTIGGKGFSPSPSLYSNSNNLSTIKIDSSALEKLSQPKKPSPLISPPKPLSSQNPKSLTLEESRAALAVLLSKLILSDSNIHPVLPVLVSETLNHDRGLQTLDFRLALGFLNSLFELNNKSFDETGVNGEEIGVVEGPCFALGEIYAILDCCCSGLVRVADAVAAVSCEAVRADVAAFDLPVSGMGFQ